MVCFGATKGKWFAKAGLPHSHSIKGMPVLTATRNEFEESRTLYLLGINKE
jgi:hypothetical protein